MNYLEVADAAQSAGAAWLTIHGRTRSDDYSREVDLEAIAQLKQRVRIPVLGNGNIFSRRDFEIMKDVSKVDGVMVSRGALGNPWVFREIKGDSSPLTLEEWCACVYKHLDLQRRLYGESMRGLIMLRKHLLWYLKGWPMAKKYREILMNAQSFPAVLEILDRFVKDLRDQQILTRMTAAPNEPNSDRFLWNPSPELNREADAAVYE